MAELEISRSHLALSGRDASTGVTALPVANIVRAYFGHSATVTTDLVEFLGNDNKNMMNMMGMAKS